MTKRDWFLVSKPLRPPFADGSSVLVRTLVQATHPDSSFTYFGDRTAPLRAEGIDTLVHKAAMGHAPSMRAKVGVLGELMRPRHRARGLHFFFTPNAITSRVVRGLQRINSGRPVIQSVMSASDVERFVPHLRSLDAVVVLSEHTRERLIDAGLPEQQVHRIYPGVPGAARTNPVSGGAPVPDKQRVLYAGDLDVQTAARLVAMAKAMSASSPDWQLVIACRPKGEGDAEARTELRSQLAAELDSGQVELHGHVDDFDALLRGCTCQLFAADHVRKKVDLPLAVLEGLERGLGLIALNFRPLNEIFDRAADASLQVGARLDLELAPEALGTAFVAALPSPAQAAIWRDHAPKLVCAHFSARALASAYRDLYERLDGRHG